MIKLSGTVLFIFVFQNGFAATTLAADNAPTPKVQQSKVLTVKTELSMVEVANTTAGISDYKIKTELKTMTPLQPSSNEANPQRSKSSK